MKTKIDTMRFFDDKKLAKEVKLTSEEFELFENFEWAVLCDNGLKNINGGYSSVTIYDTDEEDDELLVCEVECGEQDTGGGASNSSKWQCSFNRKTKTFKAR